MKQILLGAAVGFGLSIATPQPSFAGGGLDPWSGATGNSDFTGQRRGRAQAAGNAPACRSALLHARWEFLPPPAIAMRAALGASAQSR
ncbi:hypothetical protein [Methylorubrum aminovorans]